MIDLRDWMTQLGPGESIGLVVAFVPMVLIVLMTPPPRLRRVRPAAYLLLFHLILLGLSLLVGQDTPSERFFTSAAHFFLLACIGNGLLVWCTQGLFRQRAERLPKIFLDIFHGLVYLGAFIYILGEAGVEPLSLITGSAVLTAIIGLSLRDTLGNLFAGLALQAQPPFKVGDWIQWDDKPSHIGEVLEVNWRMTRLLTLDAVEITVPHAALGQSLIMNYTRPARYSRRSIYFHAPLEAPTRTVQQIVLDAVAGSFGVLEEPAPSVVTLAFDERGVQYWLRFFTVEFGKRDRVDGEARDRIWYALHRAGIAIPAPHRTIALSDASPEKKEQEQVAARLCTLHCVDFFANLDQTILERLAGLARTALFAPGEVILRQGSAGDEMFIICQGEVAVLLERPDQPPVEVARMGPGQFFGEVSLLTGEPRSATVQATRACDLLVVDHSAIAVLLKDVPALAEQISEIVSHRKSILHSKQAEAAESNGQEEVSAAGLLERIRQFFSI